MMETKNMKVYQGTGRNYMEVPKIVLQGKWLDGLGFSVGDQITVTCSEDKITIIRPADIQEGKSMEMKEGLCAEFSVYAGDTIYTPDGQTDSNGNRIVKYRKDTLVASLVTDADGTAVLNNLPVGHYYVVEEKTGENHVIDREKKEFEIVYNGQKEAVDFVDLELTNERQRISLEILKKDSITGEPIEGVLCGLYAEEEILDAEGQVVVGKDALIETGETGNWYSRLIFHMEDIMRRN